MFLRRRTASLSETADLLAPHLGPALSPRVLGLPHKGLAWRLGDDEREVELALLVSGDAGQALARCGEVQPPPVRFAPSTIDAHAIAELALVVLRAACGDEQYNRLVGGEC